MTIRRLAALTAITAIGALALGAVSASAATTLRTDPGAGLLSGSTTIRNTTSDPAVFTSGAGSMSCLQNSLDIDVSRNSSATSISGSLTSLTLASCSGQFALVPFTECSLHRVGGAIPTVTITAIAGGGTVALGDTIIRCAVNSTSACYYTWASATGTETNVTSTLSFSGVSIAPLVPTGTTDSFPLSGCGSSSTFSMTLTHMVQGGTNRTITITTS
jgi:hypothetical protein